MNLSSTTSFLGLLTTIYMILCILRIFLHWFGLEIANNPSIKPLAFLVDPWLGLFARIKKLRGKRIDFSPIVAIMVLGIISRIFWSISATGRFSFGLVLVLFISGIWSVLAFIADILAVFIFLRIIAYLARWNSLHPFWQFIDTMINPVIYKIKRLFYRNRIVKYLTGLITSILVIIGSRVLFSFLIGLLLQMIYRLPF